MGRTKGGLNSKLHAVCDDKSRPLIMFPNEGQMSDHKGAALMIDAFPKAKALLTDRGYDADWFRHALSERGIAARIRSKTNRKVPIPHDTGLCFQRDKIENTFGKLKEVTVQMIPEIIERDPATSTFAMIDAPIPNVRHPHRGNRYLLGLSPKFLPARSRALGRLHCYPTSDHLGLEFSASPRSGGLVSPAGFASMIGGIFPIALCGRSSL
jgi:transposase